ncbi:SpaA isopeptide-forming pilin-related protein [Anaerovorax odorimutans]|uniref:SpaA isopeptide-forming pilin-related protein n=2 Tax=Anaerovorax odorimutans TaxID=109327 RepID=A0ABT1RNT4_9FIRM|nr:SpaA isopeptide-forming pilin-related protein [Anaerovorax odorimutans]
MISSTLFSSAAVFAASSVEGDADPANIENYLDDAQIWADGGEYNPADSVNPEGSFSVKLFFSEISNGRQFPNDGRMTYQIPSSIKVLSNLKDQPINDTNKKEKIGTYTIETSGRITVDLDSDYVERYKNIKTFLTFEGSFTKEATEGKDEITVEFTDGIKFDVKLEKKANLEISKTAAKYNYGEGTVDYTIKVKTDYSAENVIVSDHMNGNLSLIEGTIKVTDKDGKDVKFERVNNITNVTPEKKTEAATWAINVGTMKKGETYTVTYQGKVSEKAEQTIETSQVGVFDATISNRAYAKGDNAEEVYSAAVTEKLTFSRITKKVVTDNGKLKWTVTVNSSKHMELDGYTLTDTLQDKELKLDKKTPMVISRNEVEVDKTDVPSWETLAGDSDKTWSYTFPPGAGKNTYTFVYWTNIPESNSSATAETGQGDNFKNEAVLSKESLKYKKEATYTEPGAGFLKKKFRDSYNTNQKGNSIVRDTDGNLYLRWTSEITVPASGLKKVKFSDSITDSSNYKKHEFLSPLEASLGVPSKDDRFNEVKVDCDGKYSGKITLVQNGKKGFDLYFADGADVAKSSLPASNSRYTVKISYYTKVAIANSSNTNGTWRNVGKFSVGSKEYSDYEDYSDKLFMEGEKSGEINSSAGEIIWTVGLETNRQGENSDVIVKDMFSDNQEFDSSYGVFLNGKKLTESQITKDEKEYQFHLGNLEKNKTYTLVYKTKIKKGVLSEAGQKIFSNVANVTDKNISLSLPAEVSINNKIVKKEITQKPTQHNNYEAEFTIVLNPNKMLLNSESADKANAYVLTDTYSKTMELDLNSFVITRDDGEELSAEKNDYGISHAEGDKKNVLRIEIKNADGHKYTIKYKALVLGAVGDHIDYENEAVLKVGNKSNGDKVEESVIIEKLSSEAGSSASELSIFAQKYDSANTNTKLEGAVFKLYRDSVSKENLLGTETTAGKDGIAVFGQSENGNNLTWKGKDYYLEAGIKYILVEAQAPNGYEKASKKYEFQLRDENGGASLENVPAYQIGHIFSVANEKYNFYIHKTSEHTGETLKDAGFTLYTDEECKNDPVSGIEEKDGYFTFKGLAAGTYYLKETKVPEGYYYDSNKVYTVVIDNNGDATIDGEKVDSENRTYTITNTLAGKIRVTKEVKQNGVGVPTERTFYAALFDDSEFTKEHLVSEVKALKMNNNESTTVTFDNVKVNETYYVVETDEDGNALTNTADDDTWAIAYDNQVVTLDPNNLTAESKITNSYFDQYYWAGSIDVTKRVTMDGKDFESNSIFYVGLYTDKDCTQQVGDIKPLVMDGKASTTVTFADLPINQTYYVAETDAEGKVITDSQKQLNCEMTIDKNGFTLTEENQTGSAVITNDFHDEEQFYYGGQITVNKTTTFNGKPYKTNEVFYVALFADKAHKERITDAKALKMNGGSAAKVTFENLSYGTYYLAETDKNGKALTELEAADLGFTNLMDEEIKLDGDLAEIGLENQMTEEFVTENGDDPENPKGTATQTGDDSDMALLILGMLAALTTMGILVINGRRRKIL